VSLQDHLVSAVFTHGPHGGVKAVDDLLMLRMAAAHQDMQRRLGQWLGEELQLLAHVAEFTVKSVLRHQFIFHCELAVRLRNHACGTGETVDWMFFQGAVRVKGRGIVIATQNGN
jgi:hypothetical protein